MYLSKNLHWKICNLSFITIISLILFSGCTTEADIRRDQMIKNLSVQMVQTQKMSSDSTLQLHDIKHRLGMLTGEVEEKGHQLSMAQQTKTSEFQGQLDILKTTVDEQVKQITKLETEVSSQKKYIAKVLSTLNSIDKTAKNNNLSPYDKAMKDYRNKKYTKSKGQLLVLIKSKKIKGKRKARIYHNLGMISYMKKNYNDAQTYFSKLITTYPKVSYNSNGMLFLARAFKAKKQIKEATQTYKMLIQKYPKSNSAKFAKADLKKIE